ncbi:MAG: ABC transporter ATP-binding protein [Comamonadaceae bacterium]|nr:MAG: ABC transporter ATP-binding protein [Comamonadaceae bacterium]
MSGVPGRSQASSLPLGGTARSAKGAPISEPLIRMRQLRKVYRKKVGSKTEEFLAVSDVSMDIHAGDMVSLVGPSGCGKSTLLKILAGLHDHDGGTLEIGGPAGAGFNVGRDVGMVFQQPVLLKWRTVIENVLLPADILGLDRKAATARAHALLEMVGLTGFADKMPYELSGGMQQRAAIARALIHDPKLVLMDEPFGALDALTREKMNLEMLRIWEETRKTFVVVTHSIQEAVFLGSHCAVLTAGPARMADFFAIELPEPRRLHLKTSPEFGAYVRRVYDLLGVD